MEKLLVEQLKKHKFETSLKVSIGTMDAPVEEKDGFHLEAATRSFDSHLLAEEQIIREIESDLRFCKDGIWIHYAYYIFKILPESHMIRYAKTVK